MNNKIIITSLLALLIFGCKDKVDSSIDTEKHVIANADTVLVAKPDSIVSSNKKEVVELKEVSPDSTINKLLLLENSESLKQFYPNGKTISTLEKLRESPIVIFSNNDKSQYLLAYHYEGNPKNQFSCFEIGYFEDDKELVKSRTHSVDYKTFETESNLTLGISLEELVKIKGDGYKSRKEKDKLILTYRIENYDKSLFLKRYDMPGYFMEFTLINNKVKKTIFGFDYP